MQLCVVAMCCLIPEITFHNCFCSSQQIYAVEWTFVLLRIELWWSVAIRNSSLLPVNREKMGNRATWVLVPGNYDTPLTPAEISHTLHSVGPQGSSITTLLFWCLFPSLVYASVFSHFSILPCQSLSGSMHFFSLKASLSWAVSLSEPLALSRQTSHPSVPIDR